MLLFADGFDAYGATADLTKKWASTTSTANVTWNATAGRFGGGGLVLGSGVGTLTAPTQNAGVAVYSGFAMAAFWFKASGKPSGQVNFISMGSMASATLITSINTSGQIGITNNNTPIFSTVTICDGQWHWVEAQIGFFNAGARPMTLAVDGAIALVTAQSLSTAPSPLQIINVLTAAAAITINIDDLIVWDDQAGLQTGELVTASFPIGPKRCETMWPSGAGSNTNWSPLSGANYTNVDENPTDWDTTYNSASASGIRDSYAFPATVSGVNPLVAVVNVVAKNADAGSINIQGLTYSGGSYGLGDSKLAGSAYATTQFPVFRDPATSAAWTKAGVNSAEFGVGVV